MPAKPSRKGRAARPWHHFEQKNLNPRSNPNTEAATRLADGSLSIEPITFDQGDASLHQFPDNLKADLTAYLKQPGATTKTFASPCKKFDMHKTSKNESAYFVEMNTTNKLECAIFRCGPALYRKQILVVRPLPGSAFNEGKAAIISYYGKGNSSHGYKVASRWAIWAPTGFKEDLLVDRLLIDEDSSLNTDDVIVNTTLKRNKRKRVCRTHSGSQYDNGGSHDDDNDGDDEESPFVPRREEKRRCTRRSHLEPQVIENGEDDLEEHTGEDTEAASEYSDGVYMAASHKDTIDATVRGNRANKTLNVKFRQQLKREGTTGGTDNSPESEGDGFEPHVNQTPQISSVPAANRFSAINHSEYTTPSHVPAVDTPVIFSTPASQHSNFNTCSTPATNKAMIPKPRQSQDAGSKAIFNFKPFRDGETRLSKAQIQCNSVQKLFAYAKKAGISDTEIMMLSACTETGFVNVVRDDNDDFEELLNLIEGEREAGTNFTEGDRSPTEAQSDIIVTIVPCAF